MSEETPKIRPNPRFLNSKQDIQIYLGNITPYMFKQYLAAGMPARLVNGRWYASTVNLDLWWDQFTSVQMGAEAADLSDEVL
jgi:hypothetical protein